MANAADRAAAGIRKLVASGEHGPGDRLPAERALAADLGVSRPVLREALRRLQTGGVIEIRAGSGAYVAQIDLDSVFDVRVRLEPLAARRAATHAAAGQLRQMEAAVGRMRRWVGHVDRFNRADERVHALVAQASASPVLEATLDRVAELARLGRTVVSEDERIRRTTLGDVERIVRAIERGHPTRAANAMERHIERVRAGYAAAAPAP